jgi:hypothetical protein
MKETDLKDEEGNERRRLESLELVFLNRPVTVKTRVVRYSHLRREGERRTNSVPLVRVMKRR